MDIQKEREAFDNWYGKKPKGWLKGIEYNTAWKAWQAAKAQAVPEGFVLISKNDLEMELLLIRHFNGVEYSRLIIDQCVCKIEAMIEAQDLAND